MNIKPINTNKSTASTKITCSPEDISQAETKALNHLGQHKTIPGFRQGKAPLNLIKKSIDENSLKEEVVVTLANQASPQIIKDNKLNLVGQPYIGEVKTDSTDWEIEILFPLYPVFELGEYKNIIKKTDLPKIDKDSKQGKSDEKLDKILKLLIEKIKLDIPQSLIDQEVATSFSRLIDQAQNLNLSLEKYLAAIKKTIPDVRKEYQEKAEENLKLEFILTAIANQEKITPSEEEVKQLASIGSVDDQHLNRLIPILIRRKTIDFLLNL